MHSQLKSAFIQKAPFGVGSSGVFYFVHTTHSRILKKEYALFTVMAVSFSVSLLVKLAE
jgi:hypothetical protein